MFLYRLLLLCLAPVLAVAALVRIARGRARFADAGQRLALRLPPLQGHGTCLWVHGASNGELTSARWLIETALERAPALQIVVTANSITGRDMVAGWTLPRVTACLAPVDYSLPLGRFLDHYEPAALLSLESELWPNRFSKAALRGVAILVFGARISATSARRWGMLPGLAAAALAPIRHLSPQDEDSAERFTALGIDPGHIGPVINLKTLRPAGAAEPVPAALAAAFDPERTILAASTHPGEETQVLAAFRTVLADGYWRHLILAPRHERRGDEVAHAIASAGLGFTRRSQGGKPGSAPVYLADTLGEMDLWYRLAKVCFVGGSLAAHGGHTPFEPAAHGAAIVHGPDTSNFSAAYAALDAAGAALLVRDGTALATALATLSDPVKRRAAADAAPHALARLMATDAEPLFAELASALALPALFNR